jgi:hypothetical protein
MNSIVCSTDRVGAFIVAFKARPAGFVPSVVVSASRPRMYRRDAPGRGRSRVRTEQDGHRRRPTKAIPEVFEWGAKRMLGGERGGQVGNTNALRQMEG